MGIIIKQQLHGLKHKAKCTTKFSQLLLSSVSPTPTRQDRTNGSAMIQVSKTLILSTPTAADSTQTSVVLAGSKNTAMITTNPFSMPSSSKQVSNLKSWSMSQSDVVQTSELHSVKTL